MLKTTIVISCLSIALISQLDGQNLYGTIAGNVTDTSDAAMAGAMVKIHNTDTGQYREAATNESGQYSFTDVATGRYDLTFTKPGFTIATRTGVQVRINNVSRVDLALRVGDVSESVQVSAQAGSLQTDTSEVRSEITSQTLENSPIPSGRNYQQMFRFLPGVTPPANAHSIPSNPARALTFNVNGAGNASNTTRIDGATSTNVQLPWVASYVPSLESIETVDVTTNSFDASQGLAGGAVISVHTKSGTNSVHGSGFETYTGNRLQARPFFLPRDQGLPKLVYNEFGGTFGGPIRKDKIFFFLSYQQSNDRENKSIRTTVPTAEIKRGDMSGSTTPMYDPDTGSATGAGRTAFPGNQIPLSRINPSSKKIASFVPLPNQSGFTNNYYATGPFTYDRHIGDAKLNWNATSKFTSFLRVGILDWNDYDRQAFGDAAGGPPKLSGGNPGTGWGRTYSLTAAATYIITPSLIVDAYYGATLPDVSSVQARVDEKIGLDLGIPGTNGPTILEGGWPSIQIASYTTIGTNENYMPYFRNDPQFSYTANGNWTKKQHNVRFGVEMYKQNMNQRQEQFNAGTSFGGQGGFVFGTGPTQVLGGPAGNQFNSYSTFLLGLPTTMGRNQLSDESGYTVRATLLGLYVRDQWAVTPKLTVSYGTRWEYIPFLKRADRGLERYDPTTNTMLICGVGSVPENCGVSISKRLFAPRAGVAYRLTDSFVIRAGYGITNEPYLETQALRANYPVLIPLVITAPNALQSAGSLAIGLPPIIPPNLGNGMINVPSNIAVATIAKDLIRGYIQSFNFSIQGKMKFGLTGQASYVGTRQVHQFGFLDLNAGQVIGAGQAGETLFKQFGRTAQTIEVQFPYGNGQYNALQTTLRRNFSHGLQVNASYTWAKGMGANDNGEDTPKVQALAYLSMNKQPAGFDRTHVFHMTSVWELPFGKGRTWLHGGLGAALLGGWQTNNLLSLMTGTPFSIGTSATSLNLPGSTQRADQIKPHVQVYGAIGSDQAYFDPLAFAPVTEARFGTAGYRSMRGPGVANWDFSIFRQFEISERFKVQFRGEALNFSNTPHFAAPGSTASSLLLNPDGSIRSLNGFSTVTSTISLAREGLDARQFRFGLRLSF